MDSKSNIKTRRSPKIAWCEKMRANPRQKISQGSQSSRQDGSTCSPSANTQGFEKMIAFVMILGTLVVFQSFLVFQLLQRIKELESAPLDNRARDGKGRFVKDDPSTPGNEAYKKRK